MSETKISCQGLPCPQPVLKCKAAIEKDSPSQIQIEVDNDAAKENVSRFLKSQGYQVEVEIVEGDFIIIGCKEDEEPCSECEILTNEELESLNAEKILIFIASDSFGTGDKELGNKLMYNFLLTLRELGSDLWRIVMVNGGVKLSAKEHPCVELLKELEKDGVSILVCGTCLEHFQLIKSKEVGDVTNMLDIITSFQLATKTIRV